jgi:Ca2+-binding RTX toxin-like protein
MATNQTTGGWFYQDSTSKTVITFFENGTFFLAQNAINPNAASLGEFSGMEKGSYVLNGNIFRVSTVELDTNGQLGLSSFIGLNLPYVFTGDSINVAGQVTLSRITSSTNPIVGSWYGTNLGDAHSNAVITFLADGSYFMAEDGNSDADPSGHDGMEKGTYSWDAQNGGFSAKTLVDTTGEWGLSHVSYPLSINLAGDQMNFSGLSLNRVGSTAIVSNPISTDLPDGNSVTVSDTYNLITGTSKDDSIPGTNGNDRLDGGSGKDTLMGGNGDDVYIVDNKADKIIEMPNSGIDKVESIISYTLGNNLENLELLGTTKINATGNRLNNILLGNDKSNVLSGLAGNDVLTGGLGADKLTGGLNSDTFIFKGVDDSGITAKTRDTITDFKHSEDDKIDFSGFDANTILPDNQSFNFIGSDAFSAAGQLRFDAKTHVLYGCTNASNQPNFSILLNGVKSLAADDFIL